MNDKKEKPFQKERQINSVINKPKPPSKLKRLNHFWLAIVVALSFTLVAFEWRMSEERVIVDRDWITEKTDFPEIIQTVHKKKVPELPEPPAHPETNPNTNRMNVVDVILEKKFVKSLGKVADFDESKYSFDDFDDELDGADVDIPKNIFDIPINGETMLPLFCSCAHLPTKAEQEACNNKEIQRFLHSNLRYPRREKDLGKQGTAVVNYVVDKNGKITEVNVENETALGFKNEAKRVVKMLPCMKPAKQYNQNVAVRYRIPVRFVLRN